ncbi:hypothetical protein EJ110_NYTH57148 [Nymphaea thermarum]|nr:hypothetical protein EJ110_NYTH57148 [Nymphaea thermarum]
MERREPSRKSLLGRTRLAKSGGCPNGTVPILRTAPCDPKSISRPSAYPTAAAVSPNDDQPIHEFVMLQSAFGQGYGVLGAVADLSVWEPQAAAVPGEFSAVKVALYTGPDAGTFSESGGVLAGLAVHGPELVANGTMMGGEVDDTFAGGQHATTQMGNGLFPMESKTDYMKAACIWSPSYMDSDGHVCPLEDPVSILVTSPSCYDEREYRFDEYNLCFGGPGLSSACP